MVLYSVASYLLYTVVDLLPRLGKRELVFLLLFACSFVVSVLRRFLFLLVLGMDCAFLFWHSLDLLLIILKIYMIQLDLCNFYFFPTVTPSHFYSNRNTIKEAADTN